MTMRQFGRLFVSVLLAIAGTVAVAGASQSAVLDAPDEGASPVVRQASEGVIDTGADADADADAEELAIFLCSFNQAGDYVHVSTWNDVPGTQITASGHGWWENVNCEATKANVTVQLQAYVGGKWVNKGLPGYKAAVYSGGGSSNRAAAQCGCSSTAKTKWRSVVDVDLVGQDDSPDKLTTPEVTIACKPQ